MQRSSKQQNLEEHFPYLFVRTMNHFDEVVRELHVCGGQSHEPQRTDVETGD